MNDNFTNIVIVVRNRYKLFEQTLMSLYEATNIEEFRLTVVDDGSEDFRVNHVLNQFMAKYPNIASTQVKVSGHNLGAMRNMGESLASTVWGWGKHLCFLDADMYLFQDWLPKMVRALQEQAIKRLTILGGVQHPYHISNNIVNADGYSLAEVDAVAGYCHFMLSSSFTKYPTTGAGGTGQSEDWALCQHVKGRGGAVAYILPSVMAHCGSINTEGGLATGYETIRPLPGIIYE